MTGQPPAWPPGQPPAWPPGQPYGYGAPGYPPGAGGPPGYPPAGYPPGAGGPPGYPPGPYPAQAYAPPGYPPAGYPFQGQAPSGLVWNGAQWVPLAFPGHGPPVEPYRSLRTRATVATVFYVLTIGGLIFGIVALVHRYTLLSSFSDAVHSGSLAGVDTSSADTADNVVAGAWAAYVVMLVAAAVALLAFLYAAQRNNAALGAHDLRFTPGWVVGWSLIPIVNIVMHWVVLSEVEKTSRDPRGRPTRASRLGLPISPVVLALVILFVCGLVLDGVGASFANSATDTTTRTFDDLVDRAHAHDAIFVAYFALTIVVTGLYVRLIRRILANQEQAARQAGLAA